MQFESIKVVEPPLSGFLVPLFLGSNLYPQVFHIVSMKESESNKLNIQEVFQVACKLRAVSVHLIKIV